MTDISITHAERMDKLYRLQKTFYDATRKYYLAGRDALIAELGPEAGASVLEIGCGTARNLIQIARRYPTARLFGLDISSQMLAEARKAVARQGLSVRIALARGDASEFVGDELFGIRRFDRVVYSYSLSMIPHWGRALETGLAHLKSQGSLHIVDFGTLDGWPVATRRALDAWLELFSVQRRADLLDQCARLSDARQRVLSHRPIGKGYAALLRLGPH